jgi:hypothetical protein
MGVPNSEVSYTTATPRREDHEVHKDLWWHWIKKIIIIIIYLTANGLSPDGSGYNACT